MRNFWFPWGMGVLTGFCFGFALFLMAPSDKLKLKAKGAVAVYEKKSVCEKALDTWVCSVPKKD